MVIVERVWGVEDASVDLGADLAQSGRCLVGGENSWSISTHCLDKWVYIYISWTNVVVELK